MNKEIPLKAEINKVCSLKESGVLQWPKIKAILIKHYKKKINNGMGKRIATLSASNNTLKQLMYTSHLNFGLVSHNHFYTHKAPYDTNTFGAVKKKNN